jgi:hypothetical protein
VLPDEEGWGLWEVKVSMRLPWCRKRKYQSLGARSRDCGKEEVDEGQSQIHSCMIRHERFVETWNMSRK